MINPWCTRCTPNKWIENDLISLVFASNLTQLGGTTGTSRACRGLGSGGELIHHLGVDFRRIFYGLCGYMLWDIEMLHAVIISFFWGGGKPWIVAMSHVQNDSHIYHPVIQHAEVWWESHLQIGNLPFTPLISRGFLDGFIVLSYLLPSPLISGAYHPKGIINGFRCGDV